jgi:hypothetical protein
VPGKKADIVNDFCDLPTTTFISPSAVKPGVIAMSEYRELVVTKEDYLVFLAQRLRLQGNCQREIENVSFPFLFASGSEMLRTYIMGQSEFTETLPDRYRLPDRGFIWYLFSQSIREVQIMPEKIVLKYELQDEYRKPFRQFYH